MCCASPPRGAEAEAERFNTLAALWFRDSATYGVRVQEGRTLAMHTFNVVDFRTVNIEMIDLYNTAEMLLRILQFVVQETNNRSFTYCKHSVNATLT